MPLGPKGRKSLWSRRALGQIHAWSIRVQYVNIDARHAPNDVQTFPVDEDVRMSGMDIEIVVPRVDNHQLNRLPLSLRGT
jgi:hypothetical protein